MNIILASKSPRRKEILTQAGYTFSVVTSQFNEQTFNGLPEKTAVFNAVGKARDIAKKVADNTIVIGADTIVLFGGKIIGKPKDEKDAISTLKMLSGKTHTVITGYAVICKDKEISGECVSNVTFNELSDKLIEDYVASKLPLDKAGSYGIQDGFPIVKEYSGSLSNIIGLPIEDVKPIIDKFIKR